MEQLKIHDWDKWQSYRKDRGQPPWIKIHRRLMRNIKWVDLTDAQRGQLVAIWLLAADHDGVIPASVDTIRKLCYISGPLDLQFFIDKGFIENGGRVASTRRQCVTPDKIREEEIREETDYMSIFDTARKLYPGTKHGLTPEYENFTKKNKDFREIIHLLTPAIKKEIDHKRGLKETGKFCPEWKNFATWINKKSWTQELPEIEYPEGYCPTRAITEEEAMEIFG